MRMPTVLHVDASEDERILVDRIHRRHAPPSRLVQVEAVIAAKTVIEAGLQPVLVLVAAGVEPDTGEQFAHWYRDIGGNGKLFLLTGSLDPDMTRRALAAGADGVLYRTTDIGRMASALTAVFEAHLSPSQES